MSLPLFSALPARTELALTQATRFPGGTVAHVYRANGDGSSRRQQAIA